MRIAAKPSFLAKSADGPKALPALLGSVLKRISNIGKPRIQGFVDAVTQGEWVVGWARDLRAPARRMEVAILHGEEFVGSGIADLPRKDLTASGIGDGRYGFRIRLSAKLFDGQSRQVHVYALCERGKILLQRGTLTVGGENVAKASEASSAPVGFLERTFGTTLHGWVYNPDQPDTPAVIDVYDDERYLGSVAAERSRPRLREKGYPSGVRGFVFELGTVPDRDMLQRLRARISGTGYDLRPARDFVEASLDAATPPDLGAVEPAAAATPASTAAPTSPVALPAIEDTADCAPLSVGLVVLAHQSNAEGVASSMAAWAAQDHGAVALAVFGGKTAAPERFADSAAFLSPENNDAFAAFLAGTDFVQFVRAGEELPPGFAAALAQLRGFPDVVVWDDIAARQHMPGDAARLQSYLLMRPIRGFAVRKDALLRYPDHLAADLSSGHLFALRCWLAEQSDLRWLQIPAPSPAPPGGHDSFPDLRRATSRRVLPEATWRISEEPRQASAPLVVPAYSAKRLSIGLWGGWDGELPGLAALLAQAKSDEIEILVPTEGSEETGRSRLEKTKAVADASKRGGVLCRLIDTGTEHVGICADLLRGAGGEAIVLMSADTMTPDHALAEIVGWALHPDAGAVGIMLKRGDGSIASSGILLDAGLQVCSCATQAAGQSMVADAIPFGFMAVGTRKIAAAGGIDPMRCATEGADIEFCLRLRQSGFHSILLAHLEGRVARETPCCIEGPMPWKLRALLRSENLVF